MSAHGCHCDLGKGEAPDACCIDTGNMDYCVYSIQHGAAARDFCGEWRPIVFSVAAPVNQDVTDAAITSAKESK